MATQTRQMTVDEYLVFDEQSEIRNEYIDGDIYPMTGGSANHGLIMSYTIGTLNSLLDQSECFVYPSDMRVRIDDTKYVYPDVSVVRGKPAYESENEVTLLNPTVVVEVTSPSSMVNDHISKVEFYGSEPSIQGYLLLDQERVFAEWYTRTDSGWHLQQFSDCGRMLFCWSRWAVTCPCPKYIAGFAQTADSAVNKPVD